MAYKVDIRSDWVEKTVNKSGVEGLAYRVQYYNELTQSLRRKSKKITRDTPQARRKARQLIIAEIQQMYEKFEHSSATLKELRDKYADYINSGRSGLHYQTGYQYLFNVDEFLKDVDTTILADNIKITYFNEYFDSMFADGRSMSYVKVRRAALLSMFRFGVNYGYVNSNPLLGYKLRNKKKTHELIATEDKFFTPKEMEELINSYKKIRREDYVDLIEWLYLTGMRVGEAVSLYTSDIIVKSGTYYAKIVGTQINKHGTKDAPVIDNIEKQHDTKTYAGTRYVKLDDLAIKIYKKHKDSKPYLFMTQSKPASGLTPKAWNKPMRIDSVYHSLKNQTKRLKIQTSERNVTTHLLRHTYVCKAASYGIPFDYDFLEQIGHSDEKTTREIYNHVNQANKEQLARGFKELDSKLEKEIS